MLFLTLLVLVMSVGCTAADRVTETMYFSAMDVDGDVAIGDVLTAYTLTLNGVPVGGGGGVHDILSATHSDSMASAVSRGDLITGQGVATTWSALAIGGAGTYLYSDGTDVSWQAIAAGGDVSAALNLTDNAIVRGDGGLKGVQTSGITIDDFDNLDTNGGDITGFDIWADNDVNVTNDLDVTDDAGVGGDLNVVGSITNATWTGDLISPVYGGTGIANNVANTLTFTGNFSLGLTLTANTSITLPTSGTLIASPLADDVALSFGTGTTSSLLWETADANANALLLGLPVSNGTDIPALVIGDVNLINVDLGLLNTFTFPSLSVIDTDRDSYLTFTYSADDVPIIQSNRNIVFKPNTDLDDYFTFATASNVPTIYGTGSYLRIGDAGTTAHSLASEDDFMVTGTSEMKGSLWLDGSLVLSYSSNLRFNGINGPDYYIGTIDSNAKQLILNLSGATNYVPVLGIGTSSWSNGTNTGLFDGVTQPLVVITEKAHQLHIATDGIANAGGATAILNHVGGFTAAVVGDIVRITAGTNCTAGWYWITTVTSADQVTLDRNYTSGDTTNVTFVVFHNFPMIGANGVCLKCFDGAPSDADVEIDRDGWLILDVGQANGRLYWRANNGWHYVDATAGISLPADERVDLNGHEFQIGDTVIFKVDRINEDGSFHALPYYGGNN